MVGLYRHPADGSIRASYLLRSIPTRCIYENGQIFFSFYINDYIYAYAHLHLSYETSVGMSYEEWEFSGLATKQLYRYTELYLQAEELMLDCACFSAL